MITTIAIVLGLLSALLVVSYSLLLLRNRQAKGKASLAVTIDINSSGSPHVDFIPSSNIEDTSLMKIALLYAAKIRYVQTDPEIVELYQGLMEEVVAPSDLSNNNDFIARLDIAAAVDPAQYKAATKTGERFTIRLVEDRKTDFVQCDLPFRGLLINFPVSVLLLAHAVAIRIAEGNISIFERAFAKLNQASLMEASLSYLH